uniref:J domain-containing protein n=1 Tax=Eutreptiella gymnastica TaxID=73025 RepID=A0A7S4FX57_9EUGL
MGATRTSLWVASGQAVGTTVHWRLAASGSWSRASQTELAAARVEATPQGVEAAPQAVAAAQVARLGSTEERGLLPSLWIRVAAVVMATTAVFAVTKARKVHANSARAWSMASGSADGVIAPPDEEDDPLTDLTITALVHTPDAVVIDTVTAHIDNSASVIEDEVEEEEEEVIEDVNIQDAPNNYYDLLEVDREASPVDIKSQYRKIQKICHPDIVGDQGLEVCLLLNDAVETLTNDTKKAAYDAQLEEQEYQARLLGLEEGMEEYTGQPLSEFAGPDPVMGTGPQSRAVFVDESACIGCWKCSSLAPNTFSMEEPWGRARCNKQWADSEDDIDAAIMSCPVDCIHWVEKRDLADLEFVMQSAKRANIASMMAGGVSGQDPFMLAAQFRSRGEEIRQRYGLDEMIGGNNIDWKRGKKISQAWMGLENTLRAQWKRLGLKKDTAEAE